MRNPGSVMAVAGDGTFAGSLSGGCIEQAVVSEALEAMHAGATRMVRFGAGSPYLDIKLPCGGGLDLHFVPLDPQLRIGEQCCASISARSPFSLTMLDGAIAHRPHWQAASFEPVSQEWTFGFWPAPKLLIIGHGAGVPALDGLAREMGCHSHIVTPDQTIAHSLSEGASVTRIERTNQVALLESDPWTAIIFLFHDHDWETDLLVRALELPHFYLGAMGGRTAHANRIQSLQDRGVEPSRIDQIKAPIGMFHSSRDPKTLALSTMAEVVKAYQDTDFGAELG